MSGYAWTPSFRLTPTDGPIETIDVSASGLGSFGPIRVDVSYEPVVQQREDVNRVLRPRRDGFRIAVRFRWLARGDMSDTLILTRVLNALSNENIVVELTLDGIVWREVILVDIRAPEPLEKTTVGALYELRVRTSELLSELTALSTGRW